MQVKTCYTITEKRDFCGEQVHARLSIYTISSKIAERCTSFCSPATHKTLSAGNHLQYLPNFSFYSKFDNPGCKARSTCIPKDYLRSTGSSFSVLYATIWVLTICQKQPTGSAYHQVLQIISDRLRELLMTAHPTKAESVWPEAALSSAAVEQIHLWIGQSSLPVLASCKQSLIGFLFARDWFFSLFRKKCNLSFLLASNNYLSLFLANNTKMHANIWDLTIKTSDKMLHNNIVRFKKVKNDKKL